MALSFKIHVDDGGGSKRTVDFDQNKVVIGRDPSADVVIDDIQISRTHLVLTREKNGFFAEDKRSTNGSFLDGKQLKKKVELKPGQPLTLGQDYVLTLEVEQPLPADEPQAAEEPVVDTQPEAVVEAKPEVSEPAKAVSEQPKPAKAEKPSKPKKPKKEKQPRPAGKERPKWVVILLAALVFIVVFCVIPLVVIEVTNQWCDLFAGFFNSMSPGVCP